jgi:hypothetical protein
VDRWLCTGSNAEVTAAIVRAVLARVHSSFQVLLLVASVVPINARAVFAQKEKDYCL